MLTNQKVAATRVENYSASRQDGEWTAFLNQQDLISKANYFENLMHQ